MTMSPHESDSVVGLGQVAGRVTVSAQELVDLVYIGNRLAETSRHNDLCDMWVRVNAALARTLELDP